MAVFYTPKGVSQRTIADGQSVAAGATLDLSVNVGGAGYACVVILSDAGATTNIVVTAGWQDDQGRGFKSGRVAGEVAPYWAYDEPCFLNNLVLSLTNNDTVARAFTVLVRLYPNVK